MGRFFGPVLFLTFLTLIGCLIYWDITVDTPRREAALAQERDAACERLCESRASTMLQWHREPLGGWGNHHKTVCTCADGTQGAVR